MPAGDNDLREAKARVLALAGGRELPVHVGIGRIGAGRGLVISAPEAHLDHLRGLLAASGVTVPYELRRTVELKARRPDPAAPGLPEPSTGPPEALDPGLIERLKDAVARRRRRPPADETPRA